MASVGLLYVGAVLFVNALLLLDRVDGKAAAILNLFVGALQVVLPTLLILQAGGDIKAISAAAGIYLFGFTYLYVGIGLLAGLDTTGVGWFSLFVSIAAIVFALINFFELRDHPFGVIWLMWSFLWFLFFVTLGLKREEFTRYTGWVTLVQAWVTAVVPAFLILTGLYEPSAAWAIGLAVFAVVVFALLWVVAGPARTRSRPTAPTESPTGR
ncbi:AmiS/UreI family transporter [Thermomonospora cellulosilytica]|uniref:Putative membrane protein n=1 Tax=Thermomonospora cellulosilytica TaxID=1411118 RepID=A0A7W3N1H7_9ACTN|nr:AmiS/UreI family transporter [Thermomonospora cellulosilytica]MBA9005845.1 putative membrane protein [Thermomonospora cellulosilytica]